MCGRPQHVCPPDARIRRHRTLAALPRCAAHDRGRSKGARRATQRPRGDRAAALHLRNVGRRRAAAMEIEHLELGAEDRIFVPSPLAHQTGFLYGMWLALLMGVPQIVQPVWNASRALRALNDWDGTFVQAATPFLADLV